LAVLDRFLDLTGQPAHLAKIGMIQGLVRGQRHSAAHVADGLLQTPGFMGDDAEEMLGWCIVRLDGRCALAKLFRIRQQAIAPPLLGHGQQMADIFRRRRRRRARQSLGLDRENGRRIFRARAAFFQERRQLLEIAEGCGFQRCGFQRARDAGNDSRPILARAMPDFG
jgi:hypothetical protein